MNSQTFGEKIKALRKKHHYSLKYVSEQVNYNATSLSKVEQNKRTAPERIVEPLAKLFKIDEKELVLKYLSEKLFYAVKHSDYAEEIVEIVAKRVRKEGKGTQVIKDKKEIIKSIKHYFRNKPIEKAWLFGSFARNQEISYDSDIDILVEFKRPHKISLFDIIQWKYDLADKTGREVDLVEKGTIKLAIKENIQKESVLVYES